MNGAPEQAEQAKQAPARRISGWPLLITGAAVAITGYLFAHTSVFLSYPGGDLADVHGLCSSSLGVLTRGISAAAAHDCAVIGWWWTITTIAMWGGAIAAVAGFALLAMAGQNRGSSR